MKIPQLLLCMSLFAALSTPGSPGAGAAAQVAPGPQPEKTAPPAPAKTETIETAPVTVDGRELFSVRGIKAFPAEERARTIAGRIEKLAQDRSVSPGSLKLAESDIGTAIVSGAGNIVTVVDADAELEGITRQQLARVYANRIREAVEKYRLDRSPENIRNDIRFALIATAVLMAALFLARRLYRALFAAVEAWHKAKARAVRIKTFELVRAEQIGTALRSALKTFRFLTVLALFYAWLYLVLDRFPWTRAAAANLLGYVLGPLGTIGRAIAYQAPNIVFLFILAFIVRSLLRLLGLFFDAVEKGTVALPGFDPDWARHTYKIVRLLVVAFAVVVAYPYIPGSSSPAFKGISIFLGVIVSLGSSSALSNIVAGYTMTYRRVFKTGDRVKIGDVSGFVMDMRLLVTHLRTIKNEEVTIPNSLILNSQVVNYSSLSRQNRILILHTTVGIGYDAPWRQVCSLLIAAAERTAGLLREPAPYVRQLSLNTFDVTYELNAFTYNPSIMDATYSDLHRNIQDAFNEYGVQIMTPAYMNDPEQVKVVPKDRWYAAPARQPGAEEEPKEKAA